MKGIVGGITNGGKGKLKLQKQMHTEWHMRVFWQWATDKGMPVRVSVEEPLEKGSREWVAGDIERIEKGRESLRVFLSTCKEFSVILLKYYLVGHF